MLIHEPFNGVFFGFFLIFAAIFGLLTFLARKKGLKAAKTMLSAIMFFSLAMFFVYKYYLSIDAELSAITAAAGEGGFSWWKELPLHLCNINMILIPVAILTDKKPLQSFCFFIGPLGAMMAIIMPTTGFESYSILLPRMLFYFGIHWMVFFGSISLASFGIYRPKSKDIPKTVLTIVLLSFGVFIINMIMRWTGLCPNANYFYTIETYGNPILDMFYRFIPVPYLYVMPCLLILIPYMYLVAKCFDTSEKKHHKN